MGIDKQDIMTVTVMYRKILHISCMQKVINEKVLRHYVQAKGNKTIKQREMCYIGHIMRDCRYELLPLLIDVKNSEEDR